ncbi:MAG TPA: DUF4384 domain-containing protein [Pyrinomonadaceae bacterium]|jgi:hypothetical protein
MSKNKPHRFSLNMVLVAVALIAASAVVASAQKPTMAADAEQDSRSIGDTAFTVNTRRPAAKVKRAAAARRTYQRVTPPLRKTTPRPETAGRRKPQNNKSKAGTLKTPAAVAGLVAVGDAEIGVTVWRLRRAGATEPGARLLDISAPDVQWVPERVAAESPLAEGDRVRLSVQTPRSGYLYIFDRELYADGTLGDPYLIFPLAITSQGDNRVRAGVVIEVPSQTDPTPYFTLRRSRETQTGELLTLIVTSEPLPGVPLERRPVRFAKNQLAAWLSQWSAPSERYELEGGAGARYTEAEKEAGASRARQLTIDEPTPQTIYRLAPLPGNPLLVNVTLRMRR